MLQAPNQNFKQLVAANEFYHHITNFLKHIADYHKFSSIKQIIHHFKLQIQNPKPIAYQNYQFK